MIFKVFGSTLDCGMIAKSIAPNIGNRNDFLPLAPRGPEFAEGATVVSSVFREWFGKSDTKHLPDFVLRDGWPLAPLIEGLRCW